MPDAHEQVFQEIAALAPQAASAEELMRAIVQHLRRRIPNYNWVGFYLLEREKDSGAPVLVLGPFEGAPTPHTRIPLDKGICGAAASSGRTVIIDDVAADSRYLACSLDTRSEIVAPVFVRGEVAGELDIDSHAAAAFGDADRRLVERCAALLGRYLETRP